MPIYEYRCPDGHTFEIFQRMSELPIVVCETCGKGPVEKLLYPVAVHFKGSGFYSTDYGRGGRKREREGRDGDGAGPSTESSGGEKSADSTEKKTASADKEG